MFQIILNRRNVGLERIWNVKPSSYYHLTESNKKIRHGQIYEKKWGPLQFATVFPKHENGERVSRENKKGFKENNAVNYKCYLSHTWSVQYSENLPTFFSRLSLA